MSGSRYLVPICLLSLLVPVGACAHSDASAFASDATAARQAETQATPRRYAAQVLVDPREITGVVLKVNARITALRNLYRGRPVREGEVLAEFESAELETIQRSYAETYANMEYIREISVTAEEKLMEGRMNLQWRGLSPEDVEALEDSRSPIRRLRITAPHDGYLLDVAVTEGQVVNPGAQSGLFSLSGTTLMRIASEEAVTVDAELPLGLAAVIAPGDTAWLYVSPSTPPLEASVEEILPMTTGTELRRTVRLKPLASARLLGLRNGQRLSVSLETGEGGSHAH